MNLTRWILLLLIATTLFGCGDGGMSTPVGPFFIESELIPDKTITPRSDSILLILTLTPRADAEFVSTRFVFGGVLTSTDSLQVIWRNVLRGRPLVTSIRVQAMNFGDGTFQAFTQQKPLGYDAGFMPPEIELSHWFFATDDYVYAGHYKQAVRRAALDAQFDAGLITHEAYKTLIWLNVNGGNHGYSTFRSMTLRPGSRVGLTIELIDLCPGKPVMVTMSSSGVLRHTEPVTQSWQYDGQLQRLVIQTTIEIIGEGEGDVRVTADSIENQPFIGGVLHDEVVYALNVGPTETTRINDPGTNQSSHFISITP